MIIIIIMTLLLRTYFKVAPANRSKFKDCLLEATATSRLVSL
jgi:hypothetical protein